MDPLPIDPHLERIASLVRERGALVLVAPPGSGKTTRVPPALLERGLRSGGRVVVLQPRRIAARAAAARIARERGWTLGREVGYTVRFERRTSRATRIEFVTEAILTRRLRSDLFLEGTSAVVLDEFHERSVHSDLALALVREIRNAARDDLCVVVLSATLDPSPISEYLEGCPVLEVEGRPYPVEVRHAERPAPRDPRGIPKAVAEAVRSAFDEARGHALVFLPGIGEIRRASRELEAFARSRDAVVLPLHGGLRLEDQERALAPSPKRKIILATNVAETSLTVEGVDLVVDAGFARVLRHDPRHGIDRLELVRASRRSAEQRAGRAGRTGPGRALRLWTEEEHRALPESEVPEIRRVDLSGAVLELKARGVAKPEEFSWFEAPDRAALERAEGLLVELGALERTGGPLTEVGRAMLEIPAHPRIARILAAARERGVLEGACLVAALIEERDILPVEACESLPGSAARRSGATAAFATGPSDLLLRADLFREAEARGFRGTSGAAGALDLAAARAVARARDALLRSALEAWGQRLRKGRGGEAALLRALLQGYPDRVVRRRAPGSDRGLMVGGRGVVLAPESVVRDAELFLAIAVDEIVRAERVEARVSLASAVRRDWIEEDFRTSVRESIRTSFDPEAGKVRSAATTMYRDLPLEDPREVRPPPEEAERLLAEAARERAAEIFAADERAARFLARVRSLRAWMPELALPGFEGAALGEILAGASGGRTSLAEIRALDLAGLLRAALSPAQIRALEAHAPESIRIPSGREVRLLYEPGRPPVLAARLQELFGLAEAPKVAAGRVRVLLHLLGPNFRPVQITQDLESFWRATYPRVRKDLRARYPKHAWPEDPWSAPPSRR